MYSLCANIAFHRKDLTSLDLGISEEQRNQSLVDAKVLGKAVVWWLSGCVISAASKL